MKFLIICNALVLLCVVLLFVRLGKTKPRLDSDTPTQALFRQRMREMSADIETGELTGSIAEEAERDILRVTMEDEESVVPRQVRQAPVFPSILLIVSILSAVSYFTYTQTGDLDRALGRPIAPSAQTDPDPETVEAAIAELQERLKTDPDNGEGWTLLGRSLLALGRYEPAVEALSRANTLVPNAPGIMLQYADALAMQAGGKLTNKARDLITRVLEIDPDNISALWLAGLAAVEDRDLTQAVSFLNRARELTAASGGSTQELDHLLDGFQASDKPALKADATTSSLETVQTDGDHPPIHLAIDVSESIRGKLDGTETLFVFARTKQSDGQGTGPGPSGPPVAVRRESPAAFPINLTLDRSMAMAPQFRLEIDQTIAITARISKTGTALPQSGDYYGESAIFTYPNPEHVAESPLKILITRKAE